MLGFNAKMDMIMNAADVRGIFSKGNCSAQLSWGADVWRRRLSEIPFKVPLYDDLVRVVTSRLMVITLFDPSWLKTPATCNLYGSITGSAVALRCCKAHAKIDKKMGNSTPPL